ncbi:MAG: type IV secretion system protein [Sphingobacteriia bacterium]|nr:type IV secretion system protein [Sphingobacteriia bacterium]
MKKLLIIISLIFSILSHNITTAFADEDSIFNVKADRNDDSCIPRYGFDRIINILATFGIYYWLSHDFRMIDSRGGETKETCNTPVPPGGAIKATYTPSFFGLFDTSDPKAMALRVNDEPYNPPGTIVSFRAREIGDMMCIQWLMTLGYRTVGCKYRTPPVATVSSSDKCYINSELCGKGNSQYSQSFIPITGPLVDCVVQAVRTFFLGNGSDACVTVLSRFQNNLRSTVQALLILYVMFFGIKISLSSQPAQKGEIFLFINKMILVTYFSVGFTINGEVKHGVDFIFNTFLDAALSLSQIAIMSGSANGLCVFDASLYPSSVEDAAGRMISMKHYQVWDYIDCRIAYYFGLNTIARQGVNIIGSVATLFAVMFNPIFFIIVLLILLFIMLFISVIIHVVHSFLISIIAITLVAFLAPIFVPMALFNATKRMYDGWLSALMSNVIHPMVLMAFCAFMFTIMDNVIFPSCKYVKDTDASTNMTQFVNSIFGYDKAKGGVTMWTLEVDSTLSPEKQTECRNSFGYLMQHMNSATSGAPDDFWQACINAMNSLLSCILFTFLFYFFIGMVDSIAQDLAGAPTMGGAMAVSGTALFDQVAGQLTNQLGNQFGKLKDKLGKKKTKRGDPNSNKKGGDGDGPSSSVQEE